ncbi:unnamed protein product [Rhizopus stolonifer]
MTEITDANLFVEAGNTELFEIYNEYLNNNLPKDWKVLKFFRFTLQKFYSDDFTQAVTSFKRSFSRFLNNHSTPDKRLQLAIGKMSNSVDAVLASKPAKVTFGKRRSSDKIILVDSINIENNSGPSTSKPQPEPPNKKRTISKPNTCSKKKPKRLEARDIEGLSFDQKVHTLAGVFGSNNILNLASPGLIPGRFQVEIQKIMKKN